MSNAIQKAEDVSQQLEVGGITWTREVLDLCKKTICPKGITDAEFELFVAQCRARGLNPFAGEAFCVQRRTNTGSKDNPQWVTINVLQTALAGMRARAERYGDLEVFAGAAIFEKDTCILDHKAGEVDHKYDAAKARGAFAGAWAMVKRRGKRAVLVHLLPSARRPDGPVYANNPSEHLAKCAKAAALREAYPTAFAGVYTSEEVPAEEPTLSRAESVLRAVEATPAPAAEARALPMPGPVVAFGEWKGRPVGSLSREEMQAAITYAEAQVREHPKMKEKARQTLEENLEALRAALAMEAETVQTQTLADIFGEPREPGQEG